MALLEFDEKSSIGYFRRCEIYQLSIITQWLVVVAIMDAENAIESAKQLLGTLKLLMTTLLHSPIRRD